MAGFLGAMIVTIEGNIAAGKTTLIVALEKYTGYRVMKFSAFIMAKVFVEPTKENPYLSLFYDNPKKYGLTMQVWFLFQRYRTYLEALEYLTHHSLSLMRCTDLSETGVLLDRSIFSDLVFARKNYLDGNISSEGFQYYLRLRDALLDGLPLPHVMVYLDVSPSECYRRIVEVRKRVFIMHMK